MKTLLSAAALGLAFLTAPALADGGMTISDPYARAMGAMAKSGAVFFVIENHTDTDDRLTGATSDASEKAELHTHKMDANGMMQMLEIEGGIEIPAGGSHALARGGDHVMLMGLTRVLDKGDSVTLTLTFEHAGEVVVVAPLDNDRMN